MSKYVFIVLSKKIVFWFLDPVLILGFGKEICIHLLASVKYLGKLRKVSTATELSFGNILFFLEDVPPLCLYIAELGQLACKRLFVGAFANTYYSMLCMGYVKDVVVKLNVYVSFGSNHPPVFFRKMNKLCTNWEFAFWQTSNLFSQWVLKTGFFGGLAVKKCGFWVSPTVTFLTNQSWIFLFRCLEVVI